ncbi:hypothetical protein [Lutibacter sp.]|uniref:hypothetical protein n=1 Tax=Lutibacter sp. TaxID=1925666 RepID=UPI003564603C
MLNKSIEGTFKEYVEALYIEAIQTAEKDYELIVEESKNLVNYEKLVLYDKENERVKKLIENDLHPYYIMYCNSKDILLEQFSSRYYLLKNNQPNEFVQSVYLGKYSSLLNDKIDKFLKKIPKFSYSQFIKGEECVYFKTFDNYYNIERDDYTKILDWQLTNLIRITSYEVLLIVKKYQEYCKTIKNPLEFINQQYNIIEEELVESIKTKEQLYSVLYKLFVFNGFDIDSYNIDLLLKNYDVLHSDRIEFKRVSPNSISLILHSLSNKSQSLISDEFTIYYTLIGLSNWFKDIINGAEIQELYKYPNYEIILKETLEEAQKEVDLEVDKLYEYITKPNLDKNTIREYLVNKFQIQICNFNNVKSKDYFYLLAEDDKSALLSKFKINSVFNNELKKQRNKIKEVYKIENVCWEIYGAYTVYFDTKNMCSNEVKASHIAIMSLINKMILEKDTFNDIQNTIYDFQKNISSYSLPLDVHFFNHRNKFVKIYEKCISRLEKVLNDAEPTNKVLYIQSKLKELKQKELKFKIQSLKYIQNSTEREDIYPNLFKEFLSIEAEFIASTSGISTLQLLPNIQKPNLIENTNRYQSFKYLSFAKNPDAITNLRDSLIKNNFIDKNTKLTDFKKIFAGGEINNKIIWKGNISELSFFIKNLIMDKNSIQDLKLKHWKVTINCFLMDDEREITIANLRGAKLPARLNLIENALKNL